VHDFSLLFGSREYLQQFIVGQEKQPWEVVPLVEHEFIQLEQYLVQIFIDSFEVLVCGLIHVFSINFVFKQTPCDFGRSGAFLNNIGVFFFNVFELVLLVL